MNNILDKCYCDICVKSKDCPENGDWKACELNKKLEEFWNEGEGK
jgi:hypothetical protein